MRATVLFMVHFRSLYPKNVASEGTVHDPMAVCVLRHFGNNSQDSQT